jgi:hypothetical protein
MKKKPKRATVPKAQSRVKASPDATVYLSPRGERVTIAANKQFHSPALVAIGINDSGESVVRLSDGHRLWGLTRADLTIELHAEITKLQNAVAR